jgi:hypothetical protein
MRIVSETAETPATTFYSWPERVRVDPSWRPSKEHFSENQRLFPDDIEQTIAIFLRMNCLAQGRPIDRPRLQPLIPIRVEAFVLRDILPARFLNFTCFYRFISGFLDRVNLSFRKTRVTNRPMINDRDCLHFHVQLTALQAECLAWPMLNFDESSRRLVMVSERSIAEHGAEVIP